MSRDTITASDLSIQSLFIETPLYSKIAFSETEEDLNSVFVIQHKRFNFDAHCIYCHREVPFERYDPNRISFEDYSSTIHSGRSLGKILSRSWTSTIYIQCQGDKTHFYQYILQFSKGILQKIGQFPSLETIAASDLLPFMKILNQQDLSDLRRAGGLASHGIGAGSFVYLRRIFERLIDGHRQAVEKESGPIPEFDRMRMKERVKALAAVLPSGVIDHAPLYSVLSVGVHELDEETCKRFFPPLKAVILAILQQDLQAKQKAESDKALADAMADIAGEVFTARDDPRS